MRRWMMMVLLVTIGLTITAPAFARRVKVRQTRHRTVVVVRRGWPLRRPSRTVFVHPARVAFRVQPGTYLAPVVFAGVIVAAVAVPVHEALVWEDGETLDKDDEWSEFTLNCDTRGTRLWLEVMHGKVQVDWAEVVFENGDTRVVDFAEKTHGPGVYSLLDFRDGRMVDHVRMVARAKSDQARVVLRMER